MVYEGPARPLVAAWKDRGLRPLAREFASLVAEVVPLEDGGDRLGLDRGGDFVALLVHGFENGGCQFQFVKSHSSGRHPWRLGIGLYDAVGAEPVKGR